MKTKAIFFILVLAVTTVFTACEKEETPKPEINNFELGYENNKTVHAGEDLHIDAEIVALGKIDRIQIVIHKHHHEHEHKSLTALKHAAEWELDTVYTKFSGLKNTRFHEHIDIPEHAEEGEYAVHFIVIDMEGNTGSIDDELEIKHEHN